MQEIWRRTLLALAALALLAACGAPNEQSARQTAKKQGLPPTETQLLSQLQEPGHDAQARLLVEAGVNPNARLANGTTALMLAAFNGAAETAAALLAKGADVQAHAGGYDALGFAVEKGDVAMVSLLVGHGADPQRVPPEGKSAVQRAQQRADAAALLAAMGLNAAAK